MRKQITTRVSDFKQLLEDGNLYVDKTRFVYDLVRQKGNDYFFIRVGGETRSHRSDGSDTPVLAPGAPEP